MKIVLARHGETEFNRNRIIMGQQDSPLTPEGRDGVEALARALAGEGIEDIYASSLGRAAASARIHGRLLGLPVNLRPELKELAFGRWEGRPREELPEAAWPLRPSWDYRPPGGESYLDAEARVGDLIQELRSLGPDRTVLVIGHAAVNRVFVRLWLDLEPAKAGRVVCGHDKAYILEDGRVEWLSAGGQRGQGFLWEGEKA